MTKNVDETDYATQLRDAIDRVGWSLGLDYDRQHDAGYDASLPKGGYIACCQLSPMLPENGSRAQLSGVFNAQQENAHALAAAIKETNFSRIPTRHAIGGRRLTADSSDVDVVRDALKNLANIDANDKTTAKLGLTT